MAADSFETIALPSKPHPLTTMYINHTSKNIPQSGVPAHNIFTCEYPSK